MARLNRKTMLVGGVALIVAMASQSAAQTPSDLQDLVGARGAGGETQLQARGYRWVKTSSGDDRKWSYWWNDQRRQCISVATADGRYASIVLTPAPDCNQQARATGNAGDHESHDSARHPDIGFQSSGARASGSNVEPEGGYVEVEGKRVELGLVCFGDGQGPGVTNSYGWTWDYDKDRYSYGNRVELTTQQFDASVMIQLWSGGGRIKLPKKLIPPIHSRGDGNWWEVYNVSMQPDRITGEYRLNGLNKPRITIDRRSGRITIVGMSPYGFRGTCDLIDGQDHRRF